MANGRPRRVKTPFDAPHTDESGAISRAWQDYYREIDERLDSKFQAVTSDDVNWGAYSTGNFAIMPNGSVKLSPGVWELSGQIVLDYLSGLTTEIQGLLAFWTIVNGDNTSTVPTPLPIVAGSASMGQFVSFAGSVTPQSLTAPIVRTNITENTDVWLVPRIPRLGTSGQFRVYSSIYAKRISPSVGKLGL
jgi:hypothetical protein